MTFLCPSFFFPSLCCCCYSQFSWHRLRLLNSNFVPMKTLHALWLPWTSTEVGIDDGGDLLWPFPLIFGELILSCRVTEELSSAPCVIFLYVKRVSTKDTIQERVPTSSFRGPCADFFFCLILARDRRGQQQQQQQQHDQDEGPSFATEFKELMDGNAPGSKMS